MSKLPLCWSFYDQKLSILFCLNLLIICFLSSHSFSFDSSVLTPSNKCFMFSPAQKTSVSWSPESHHCWSITQTTNFPLPLVPLCPRIAVPFTSRFLGCYCFLARFEFWKWHYVWVNQTKVIMNTEKPPLTWKDKQSQCPCSSCYWPSPCSPHSRAAVLSSRRMSQKQRWKRTVVGQKKYKGKFKWLQCSCDSLCCMSPNCANYSISGTKLQEGPPGEQNHWL